LFSSVLRHTSITAAEMGDYKLSASLEEHEDDVSLETETEPASQLIKVDSDLELGAWRGIP